MKTFSCFWGLFFLMLPTLVRGIDFGFQPRFETGTIYYEREEEEVAENSALSGFSNMVTKRKIQDVLPFVGGGVTFSVQRFFVDFNAQYAFGGEDNDSFTANTFVPSGSVPIVPVDTVTNIDFDSNDEFDRLEYTVSVGFAVTDNFLIFAGYKRTETDFDEKLDGRLTVLDASNLAAAPLLQGNVATELSANFEYDGPFVGTAYNWDVNWGVLNGVLTGNLGVAFLEGKSNLKFKDFLITDPTGAVLPIDTDGFGDIVPLSNLDGDTTGLSLGLAWKGLTPVDGLFYSIGLNGYRYDFDGNNNSRDFNETLVRFQAGISYSFN